VSSRSDAVLWALQPAEGARHAAQDEPWRCEPRPGGTPPLALLRHAGRREWQLVRRRLRPGRGVRACRLPGGLASPLGGRLRGGAVVVPVAGEGRLRIDAVAAAAGMAAPVAAVRPIAGGLVLARGCLRDGTPVVLRAGPEGSTPWRGQDVLAELHAAGVRAPRPVGAGRADGAEWAVETVLDGRAPRRVTPEVVQAVVRQLARFPQRPAPPALLDDLGAIGAALGDRADVAALARRLEAEVGGGPSVLRHGDLWRGNVLVSATGDAGLVDWDAARWGAVPGADLLQLLVTEERRRRRNSLGEAWSARPWRSEPWRRAARHYWDLLGLAPDEQLTTLAGIAWWAAEVAGTLRRYPERASDDRWLAANVDVVLDELAAPRQ